MCDTTGSEKGHILAILVSTMNNKKLLKILKKVSESGEAIAQAVYNAICN